MSGEITIVTDTAASITRAEAERENIKLVPLHIVWPERQETDHTIGFDEFYALMEKEIPTTSGATPADMLTLYDELTPNGDEEIASVHVTELKSMTYPSAVTAAEQIMSQKPDVSIEVINSRTVSLSQFFLAQAARDMALQGLPLPLVRENLLRLIPETNLYVTLPSLDHLKKSRRVDGIQAVLAAAFKLVPTVTATEEGDLKVFAKPRRKRGALRVIQQELEAEADRRKKAPYKLGVVYTQEEEVGLALQESLRETWGEEVKIYGPNEAGPALSVHTGPGAAAICVLWENELLV